MDTLNSQHVLKHVYDYRSILHLDASTMVLEMIFIINTALYDGYHRKLQLCKHARILSN